MSCLTSSGVLYVTSLTSFLDLSLASFLDSSLDLLLDSSLTLSLAGFSFSLRYSRSACFSIYIIGLDKQLYIKLVDNQYRRLISFVWSCNIYLTFCSIRLIHITYCPSTGPSTVSLTTARSSYITNNTSLI